MSQERTAGQLVGEAWTKIQVLRDEIDRLNATIAGQAEAIREQTAKVQERDWKIKQMEEQAESLSILRRETLAERDKEIERLREHEKAWKADHKADIEENSRLRAAMVLAKKDLTKIKEQEQDDTIAAAIDWVIVGISAALKGAE